MKLAVSDRYLVRGCSHTNFFCRKFSSYPKYESSVLCMRGNRILVKDFPTQRGSFTSGTTSFFTRGMAAHTNGIVAFSSTHNNNMHSQTSLLQHGRSKTKVGMVRKIQPLACKVMRCCIILQREKDITTTFKTTIFSGL